MNDKRCPNCGETKPLTVEFWRVSKLRGWVWECRACCRKRDAVQRSRPENGVRMREYHRRWRALPTGEARRRMYWYRHRAKLLAGTPDGAIYAELAREIEARLRTGEA